MFHIKNVRVLFEADVDSGPVGELFTPTEALAESEKFWNGVLETMNERAIKLLAWHFSEEIKNRTMSADDEVLFRSFEKPGIFSFQIQAWVDDFEAPIIEVAMNEKPGSPARGYKRWSEMYDSPDPRVRLFLQSENISSIYKRTLQLFQEIGWGVSYSEITDEGFPDEITFSVKK